MADTNFDSVVANTFTGTFVGPVGGAVAASTISATGQITGAAGTVSLPEYSFTGDLDCGLYRIGANNLGIAVNAAKVLDIATTGLAVTGALSASTTFTANTSIKTGAGGTALTQIKVYSQTITPSSVNAATVAEQTFTVTGLTTADNVIINPAATGNATAACSARVSASDTLAVQFVNPTAGGLTPGAGTWTIIAIRS